MTQSVVVTVNTPQPKRHARVPGAKRADTAIPAKGTPEPKVSPGQAAPGMMVTSAIFFAGALLSLALVAPTALLHVYVAIPVVVLSGAIVLYQAYASANTYTDHSS